MEHYSLQATLPVITLIIILTSVYFKARDTKSQILNSFRSFLWDNSTEPSKPVIAHFSLARDALRSSSFVSRAHANVKLKSTFELDNAFTTTDQDYKNTFVKFAHVLLKNWDERRWEETAVVVKNVVESTLDRFGDYNPCGSRPLSLAEVVRVFCLKAVLISLLGAEVSSVLDDPSYDLEWSTQVINNLWMSTKDGASPSPNPSQNDCHLDRLIGVLQSHVNLASLGSSHESAVEITATNPLNLILPAYETLWRLVLLTLIEVFARQNHSVDESWSSYLSNPTDQTFREEVNGSPSMEACVLEMLRLYPPTKRIHRVEFTVDVEAIHRDFAVWGPEALRFKPERFSNNSAEMASSRSLLSFGQAPMLCPAHKFAPRFAGLLVAALIDSIEGKWEINDRKDLISSGTTVLLPNGRNELEGFTLNRIAW